jgi:hypothetical protein
MPPPEGGTVNARSAGVRHVAIRRHERLKINREETKSAKIFFRSFFMVDFPQEDNYEQYR